MFNWEFFYFRGILYLKIVSKARTGRRNSLFSELHDESDAIRDEVLSNLQDWIHSDDSFPDAGVQSRHPASCGRVRTESMQPPGEHGVDALQSVIMSRSDCIRRGVHTGMFSGILTDGIACSSLHARLSCSIARHLPGKSLRSSG
jgi:hypothetical protein